jgi:predicted nucleotidyltransferase
MKTLLIAALTASLLSGCVLSVRHRHDDMSSRHRAYTHAGQTDYSRAQAAPTVQSKRPPRPATINHIVFFKLKDPAKVDALVTDCDTQLAAIPGVASYFCGTHLDTGRDSVDDNYDVGLYIGFDSKADYETYVTHPNHTALVKKWLPALEWLQVRDIGDDTP